MADAPGWWKPVPGDRTVNLTSVMCSHCGVEEFIALPGVYTEEKMWKPTGEEPERIKAPLGLMNRLAKLMGEPLA